MSFKYVELHKAVNLKKSRESMRKQGRCGRRETARHMEKLVTTKSRERQVESRASVRQAL